jgi:hypothetical protein
MDRQDVRVQAGGATYNVGFIVQPDAIHPKRAVFTTLVVKICVS